MRLRRFFQYQSPWSGLWEAIAKWNAWNRRAGGGGTETRWEDVAEAMIRAAHPGEDARAYERANRMETWKRAARAAMRFTQRPASGSSIARLVEQAHAALDEEDIGAAQNYLTQIKSSPASGEVERLLAEWVKVGKGPHIQSYTVGWRDAHLRCAGELRAALRATPGGGE